MSEVEHHQTRPSIVLSIALIVGAVGFMAVFFVACGALGVTMPVFGLLFLVYWAAILRQDLSLYVPSLVGSVAGIFIAWLVVALFPPMGTTGAILSFGTIAAMLFCFMRGHAAIAVNNATMLFLTVATVAQLDVKRNLGMMVLSLVVGAAYMGATAMIVKAVRSRRKTVADPAVR